jgi:hypothetical protein
MERQAEEAFHDQEGRPLIRLRNPDSARPLEEAERTAQRPDTRPANPHSLELPS